MWRGLSAASLLILPHALCRLHCLVCATAADVRSNENLSLQALHNLFVREHNHRCDWLMAHNPSWTDDELYSSARRFVIALIQVVWALLLIVFIVPRTSAKERAT